MELYDGRPDNTDGRQDNEIRVYDLLDSLGIQYKRTDHEPATTKIGRASCRERV